MAKLDFAALQNKLSELQKKGNDAIFKPEEGDTIIRIVPLQGSPENPFQELYFHYGLAGKTYLSPRSYGEADPIADFSDALVGEGGLSKEEYKQAKKFSPQLRTYVPIVVRGKEKDGVKFWAFGKQIFEQLLKIMNPDDYGDITDIHEGYDLKITFTPQEKSDTSFAKTEILVRPKPCPLTSDKELLERLLSQQPVLMDCYKKHSYKELEEALQKFINPSTSTSSGPAPREKDEEDTVISRPTPTKISVDVEKEFDEIFSN